MNTKSFIEVAKQAMSEIHVNSEYSGHNPGSESDKYFLAVYHLMLSFAIENLKMMVSLSTIVATSLKETKKFENMVIYFEQIIFQFFYSCGGGRNIIIFPKTKWSVPLTFCYLHHSILFICILLKILYVLYLTKVFYMILIHTAEKK